MPERPSLILDNSTAQLVVDLLGGSIVSFQFTDQCLNPLVWNNEGDSQEPRQMGHFLCLDRWGSPSKAEAKNGMPYHGEAGLVQWQVIDPPFSDQGLIRTRMRAHLPIAGLDVRRSILLYPNSAFFTVSERVTNLNPLGSVLNMVQHPSIGPPFLDENTLVDANAGQGFAISTSSDPNPEARTTTWPTALNSQSMPVNMRVLLDDQDPAVVAYVLNGCEGWVTASNPARGLLIGYVWKTVDYPWFNAWRRVDGERPFARGLEFGTTGLDWPHGDLLRKGSIFGHPLFVYLDAGQQLSKSYSCFLVRIPTDYAGVNKVRFDGGNLKLTERAGGGSREIAIALTQSRLPSQS